MSEFSILFCCMGNICRSPMAAALFRHLADEAGILHRLSIDSAGTHADFPNAPADPRARRILAERGIDLGGHRARRITRGDFDRFDLILAMDSDNYDALQFVAPRQHAGKIARLLDYAPNAGISDIPDPYHEDESMFLKVLDLLQPAVQELLAQIRKNL